MASPNHYEVLGLAPEATPEEIDRRYQELVKLYGIDQTTSGDGMAALVKEAYRVLSSPALRAVHDSALSHKTAPQAPAERAAPTPQNEITLAVPAAAAPPAPDLDRTVAFTPTARQTPEVDRRLAAELAKRGIPPDELRRLAALEAKEKASGGSSNAPDPLAPKPFVPRPTISLPPVRESTAAERAEADRLLTAANLARRRDNFRLAEEQARSAVELVPMDASALELYGDILQATGRVDDAVLVYKRATELDPNRRSAEKKYGDLVLRQDRSAALIKDEVGPGNPHVAVLFSAVLPGGGQMYNGEVGKGLLTMLAFAAAMFIIFYTPLGIPHDRGSIPASLVVAIVVAAIIYLFGVVDANLVARRGRRRTTGWEV